MKIFIDIGHPAHVHYFRNFISEMRSRGHLFMITAREKDVTIDLLREYGIEHICRGKGKAGFISKLIYMVRADIFLYRKARKFRPDIFMSFGSPYASHTSFLLRKPNIIFDDTEAARWGRMFYKPFTDVFVHPAFYKLHHSDKQLFINSFMELCYLHPKRFTLKGEIYDSLPVDKSKPLVFIRLVSWIANHDYGQSGISMGYLTELINEIGPVSNIIISTESEMPGIAEKYRVNFKPGEIHHILARAALYIGEGATMAAECALLGVPAIYVNTITAGTIEELEKHGLLYHFKSESGVKEKSLEILTNKEFIGQFRERQKQLLDQMIDFTGFMTWFVENYPESYRKMKEIGEYENNFR